MLLDECQNADSFSQVLCSFSLVLLGQGSSNPSNRITSLFRLCDELLDLADDCIHLVFVLLGSLRS